MFIKNLQMFNQSIQNSTMLLLFVLILIGLGIALVFNIIKIQSIVNDKFEEKSSEADSINKEYQLYPLFIGMLLPIIEISFEIFNVRPKSLLIVNCCIGLFFILLYFISKKVEFVFQRTFVLYPEILSTRASIS